MGLGCQGLLHWNPTNVWVVITSGVQLLLLVTSTYAATTPPPVPGASNLTTERVLSTSLPVGVSSSANTSTQPASASSSPPTTTPSYASSGDAITTAQWTAIDGENSTTFQQTDAVTVALTTIIVEESISNTIQPSSSSSSSSPSVILDSTTSGPYETDLPTSMTTVTDEMEESVILTTEIVEDLVTYELDTDDVYTEFVNGTGQGEDDDGFLTESLLRLIIIAGATAVSCIILLIILFVVVACYHRKREQRRNSRYYEFKKKDFSSKYERVEMKNSLARQGQPDNTPVGGGWVFSANAYGVDYDDELTPSVKLRSISPIPVATPLLKLHPSEDSNGVPDSGHGGSIPPDDSALGFVPSLEEDIELELSPIYRALGTSIGTGSEVRDHSYIGGDSDTISEGNEPVVDTPIRDVHFNSFGAKTKTASEEALGH